MFVFEKIRNNPKNIYNNTNTLPMLKTFILLLVTNVALSQQYDSVYIERTKIDNNNSIYQVGKKFMFECEIIINDTVKKLINNSPDKFSLVTVDNDSTENLIIPLSIIKPKLFIRSNKKQTQALYSFISNDFLYESYTGIVENDKNIWMHPPRFGFFKSLETCPFPYIKLQAKEGESWKDQMLIGDHWSNNIWGYWVGSLLLNYEYTFTHSDPLTLDFGQIDCKVIEATAISDIGISKLTSYYSSKYGFVKLEYTLFSGIKVNLTLKSIKNLS